MRGHMHGGFGGFGGFGGRPIIVRRTGYPLFGGMGMGGLGMGGLGTGLGGGGLMSDLLAGGLGYLVGSHTQNAQYQQYPPQYQQVAPQYQQYPAQYQSAAPEYQQPTAQESATSTSSNQLAQLKLLGQLRQSGVLTEDEFQAEKQKILNGS